MADTSVAITAGTKTKSRAAYLRDYRSKNKEKWLRKVREYRRTPKGRASAVAATRKYRSKPENKEREQIRQVEYRRRLKQAIFKFYGDTCNCCAESNPLFLSVDHVDNDGYKEKRGSRNKRPGGRDLYGRIIKENFPGKYQILCMNCNFGKSKNGGICPHLIVNEQTNG